MALPNISLLPTLSLSGINIAHYARGYYEKIRPRVLANDSARYIFTSSSTEYNNYYF